MRIVEDSKENNIKASLLERQNKQADQKIEHYNQVIALLEIRKKHFDSLTKLKFIPLFIRAKFRLKFFEIEAEIISKTHFVNIYKERIMNVDYAENVLTPSAK